MCSQAVLLSIQIVRKMRRLKCKWLRVIGVSFWLRGSTALLGGESGGTMQLSRMSSYCWPQILGFSDLATRFNPADPRREEHFKTKSFTSSHIGEVVCQLPAWRKKRFTWRGRFWELVNNRWFTLSSFSWSLPSLVVDKLTSYSVF